MSQVQRAALLRAICVTAVLSLGAAAARGEEDVPVPGGPAAVRRLFHLDASRPKAAFFLDLHEFLLSSTNFSASWSYSEPRKALVSFAEDLAEWRSEFGNPAVFSLAPKEQWKRVRNALGWLGFKVKGEAGSFSTERKEDERSVRRQTFLDRLDTPLSVFLSKLKAGEKVTIASSDEGAPFPFGLAAWRDTLDEPKLSTAEAFLYFVKNVQASRMLVALHALDPDTRDGLRGLFRDGKGRSLGWRLLYEKALDAFCRFPEALTLRGGHFVLPGGKEAEAIWADIVGVSPGNRLEFLTALYQTDSGKPAYVVDVLQQLQDRTAKELLLGRTGGGQKAVKRFRRLYKAIERSGDSFEMNHRDPYDFAHLARFLKLSDDGELSLPVADLEGGDFPRSEGELAEILAGVKKRTPEETLRILFRHEAVGAAVRLSARRRFLFISSLLEGRPWLGDPGVTVLLFRGLDRFLPAYAVLEDIPLDGPRLARRFLFTLDRLDRRGSSREMEVSAGLFEGGVEILAQLSRAGALDGREIQDLFAAFLDLPLFSREEAMPAQGERDLFGWLSGRLLSSLRAAEGRLIEATRQEEDRRETAYRGALAAREGRVLARHERKRTEEEAQRASAEEKLNWYLSPACVQNDEIAGPFRPRYLEEEEVLARSIPVALPEAEAAAQTWMNEALDIERERARPLSREARPARIAGAIAGTSVVVDPGEAPPELIRVDIPEESSSSDEFLTRALAGTPVAAHFDWRGGRYRFDPTTDDANRRREFREKQRLTWLADLEELHRKRDALTAAAAKGDLPAFRSVLSELRVGLRLSDARTANEDPEEDERIRKEHRRAREAIADLAQISKPKKLSSIGDELSDLDAVMAERHLEALLGHVYAASAGDPNDLYYQEPGFVRRHSFRTFGVSGKAEPIPFAKTELAMAKAGGGSRVVGSLFGLSDALGLLHADQIRYKAGSKIGSDEIRSGLVGPVRRMSAARLDDDALKFVAASCRATEEFAAVVARGDEADRPRLWNDLARDLVPRSRLGLISGLSGGASPDLLSQYLSPSDLYRIGKRLAREAPSGVPALPSAIAAREALERLEKRLGEAGARDRLSEFGPRAISYAGRFRLADLDLPPYERTTVYRSPLIFSDRLYDLKISVARRVEEAGLPAAVLPLVTPAALDEMMGNLKMAFTFDWSATVRAAQAFSKSDVDRLLDDALRAGRFVRNQSVDTLQVSE